MNIYICLFVFLVFAGCSSQKDETTAIYEMEFRVDPDLMGDEIVLTELGVVYNPPAGWEEVPDSLIGLAAEQILRDQRVENSMQIVPVSMCFNNQRGGVLFISEIIPRYDESTSELLENYKSELVAAIAPDSLQSDLFMKDGIRMHQYLVRREDLINFKFLFISGEERVMLADYILLYPVYRAEREAIESSIGSIKLLKN